MNVKGLKGMKYY